MQFLVKGLTYGFDIATNRLPELPQPQNHISANDHAKYVTKGISKELRNGHIAGPFASPPWPNLNCSPTGTREKDDGSYRLLMDLSYPRGKSINDFISKDDFSVEFMGFDTTTDLVRRMGYHCLMFEIDIQHAFRVLPIRPSQWILMGSEWMGYYFIDIRLPFGLRSSPGIFNPFADTIYWILQNIYKLPYTIHYSEPTSSLQRTLTPPKKNTNKPYKPFEVLGLPVATEKTVPPPTTTTSLPYLGTEINS